MTLERNYYLSGKFVRREVIPFKDVSLAIKPFSSAQEIPSRYLGYAGVTRVLVNESGNILVPVEPERYFLVDVHASPIQTGGKYTHAEFSRTESVLGTLEIEVKKGVANYIGHIHVIEVREDYEDLNGDSFIDANEFKSNFRKFEEVSRNEKKFSKKSFLSVFSFSVRDESSESIFPLDLKINLARFVKF
ncbi:MAG: hypothetical protein K2Y28_17820 [Burkholderiaceae bacterium]|nr:hypothetical protein [Burkholderiaceae bacterium]